MAISDIKKNRVKKLEEIEKKGKNPYPSKCRKTQSIESALSGFEEFSRQKTELTLAGRIRSIREHGGSTFLHIEDDTGKIQGYLKRDRIGKDDYDFFLASFDIGDFLEISGILFETKKGEKTMEISGFRILSKSLLPLPEKWHGLKDVEERFRKRYLDLLMNPEARNIFRIRSKTVQEIRNFLGCRGFSEVETPILQKIPGGALAKPFKTHLNSLNLDLYMRVAPELFLKRLLIGGFEKIYEIGRCFRNEGVDRHHNPDFTMLELYWAYQDKEGLMDFTEEALKEILKKVKGSLKINYQGTEIDFEKPWKKISFRDILKSEANLDVGEASDKELKEKLGELGIEVEKEADRKKMMDEIFKKACREKLFQPTFIFDQPVEMAILAKAKAENPDYADRFQLIAGGIELINGFSELNDPREQEKRFKSAKIEEERKDEDFLEALNYGMPPSAGLGMGIDRLIMLFTDSRSLREVILFPIMRPRLH